MNGKLERYDLLIDLADIKTISIRMKVTGKISKKILKKWKKRDLLNTQHSCTHRNEIGQWLPASVFSKDSDSFMREMFWWQCRRCRSICNFIWDFEATESQKKEYPEHIREWTE